MQASGYQNLHTNSIIQIESDVDSDQLVFGWRRLHPTKPYPFNHDQWMQHLGSEYTCTPLDYQCQIELKINVNFWWYGVVSGGGGILHVWTHQTIA